MDTATNHTQQVQGKKPSSSGGNDKTKTDIVTTATDGTTRQQLNMMPGGGNFLQLIPETRGGGNTSVSTNTFPCNSIGGVRSPSWCITSCYMTAG